MGSLANAEATVKPALVAVLSPVHTSNNVEATGNFVAVLGNNVEATFDFVERTKF